MLVVVLVVGEGFLAREGGIPRGKEGGCLCALNSALFALVSSTCFSRAAKILRLLSCGREEREGPNIPSHITNAPAEYHRIWPFSLFRVGRLSSDFSLSLPLSLSPVNPIGQYLHYLIWWEGEQEGQKRWMRHSFLSSSSLDVPYRT